MHYAVLRIILVALLATSDIAVGDDEINVSIIQTLAAHRNTRARCHQLLARDLLLLRPQIAHIGTDAQRLREFQTTVRRSQTVFWQTVRDSFIAGRRKADPDSQRFVQKWYSGLSAVAQRSELAQYFRHVLLASPDIAAAERVLRTREAEAGSDVAHVLQQIARVFAARVHDRRNNAIAADRVTFYQQQLDTLLVAMFDLLGETVNSYWEEVDLFPQRSGRRYRTVMRASAAIAV